MNRTSVYTQRVEQLADECHREFPDAPGLSPSEFARRSKQEDWAIVDVRSPRKRAVSIIPGAATSEEFEARSEEHKGKHILVYCTAGCRSGAYAETLREEGLDAFNLWGGVLSWAQEGGLLSPSMDSPLAASTSTGNGGMCSHQTTRPCGESISYPPAGYDWQHLRA